MKKIKQLLFALLFSVSTSYGQFNENIEVRANFNTTYTFNASCKYDNDLKRTYDCFSANSTILVDVKNGEGVLIIYVGNNKNIFNVTAVFYRKDYNSYFIGLESQQGVESEAEITFQEGNSGYYAVFWLSNYKDRTKMILFRN